MTQYALQVQSLTKKIGNKVIVDDVSFAIEKGEIFGLLGPNGAGKTTIIRMIVSLINRTAGTVIVNNKNLDDNYIQAMAEMGAIVENPEFYKYLSGKKNLQHYANMALTKISKERMDEVVKLVKLEDAIQSKVKTYSLGMRQRLGVAQALLHSPSILILDEPTNGLDPQGIREFREYLRTLTKQGISVLVSSHMLSEMQLMCDRFAIIEKGKLIHIATMDETNAEQEKADREYTFEVDNTERAYQLLEEEGYAQHVKEKKDNKLTLLIDRGIVADINKLLVQNDIAVFEISFVKATLEDRFLEITNQVKEEQSV
ncbi:MAG: ABC transporter ATP-binding protein [Bacillaceae bacterium]